MTLRRDGDDRKWPHYLFWGRMRTSTAALIVAFFATWWVYDTYKPPEPAVAVQGEQPAVPAILNNPEYTWVPRTQVLEPRTTTPTTTTTTTTTETSQPDATDTTSPTSPTDDVPAVVDPDGAGPLPPTTVTTTSTTVATIPGLPTPTPTTTTTVPTPIAPPR